MWIEYGLIEYGPRLSELFQCELFQCELTNAR